ncbi:MAG: glyoxalase [Paenibacillus sp.]|jgi:uncharacterized glyoxalase superfamily protein PhnB|nr:glyoxalase [Paenibacillus sp.]
MYGELSKIKTNRNLWLEFKVTNIDEEYERLKDLGVTFIKEPTVQPWGNKSFYFSDPDGNPISFFQTNYR